MVSIRRRKLLRLCSGMPKAETYVRKQQWRRSFLSPLSRFFDNGDAPVNLSCKKPVSVHPIPSIKAEAEAEAAEPPKEEAVPRASPVSSNVSGYSSSKEPKIQECAVLEVKRRKRYRRKLFQNQEECLMRGVYYKNMKWQAAIKVDKKQIHLGTVGSQEEAAHLYDRAAYMCGREPNFELSEEEKQELRQLKWDDFLARTRSTLTSKVHRRRRGAAIQSESGPSKLNTDDGGQQEANGFSASEIEPETSLS